MVTITVNLDKRKVKKDGTYPICFGIYFQGKSTTRSSKIYVSDKYWDDKKKQIKTGHSQAQTLNRLLTKQLADLQSSLLFADEEKVTQYLTPTPVVKEVVKPKQTVFSFTGSLIEELRVDNKIGNSWVSESALNALKKFHPADLNFEEIDFQFLDKYNKHLLRSGVKHNTAFFYLRTLRGTKLYTDATATQKLMSTTGCNNSSLTGNNSAGLNLVATGYSFVSSTLIKDYSDKGIVASFWTSSSIQVASGTNNGTTTSAFYPLLFEVSISSYDSKDQPAGLRGAVYNTSASGDGIATFPAEKRSIRFVKDN